MAPITWIFGPIATLNVALLLSPVVSGMAMFILLRRWVSWEPAAFIGGVLYGFSPLILTNLYFSHLNLTMSPIPPLLVACLDEIVIRQRRRPVVTGVLLGLLLTLQFFLSTELLVIMALAGAFGLVLVTAFRRVAEASGLAAACPLRPSRSDRRRQSWRPSCSPIRPGLHSPDRRTCRALSGPTPVSTWPTRRVYLIPECAVSVGWLYGFDGPLISGQYLGIGLVVVLLGGLVAFRRDLRLCFFGIIGLVFVSLSLGAANPLFGSLPVFENILPNRFDQVVYLCVAIMLGIVVDQSYAWVTRRHAVRGSVVHPEALPGEGQAEPQPSGHGWAGAEAPSVGWTGAVAGLLVAGIALVPIGLYFSQNVPIPVQSSPHVPSWFRTAARHLGPNQVLLVFPDNLSGESPLIWQVGDGMRYAIADEFGSSGTTAVEPPGLTVLVNSSLTTFSTVSVSGAARGSRRARLLQSEVRFMSGE